MPRIFVIGAGYMGSAILHGLIIKSKDIQIIGVDLLESRREALALHHIDLYHQLPVLFGDDVVVLAIKPQDFPKFCQSCKTIKGHHGLVISVMAGVRVNVISNNLNLTQVVRAIPNIHSEVFEGATIYYRSDDLSEDNNNLTREVLSTIGHVVVVHDENMLDPATALCGGGPAFVAYFADGMRKAAERAGFNRTDAMEIIVQLFKGTATLMSKSGKLPMQLCHEVMTPKGTTERGIKVFEESHLHSIIEDALGKSTQRSIELGVAISSKKGR